MGICWPIDGPNIRQNDEGHFVSDQNPLDLIKRDLIVAPVVKPGCAGGFVIGHLLRHLELAAVA